MIDTVTDTAALTKAEATEANQQEADAVLLALSGGLDFSGPPGSHHQARFGALVYKAQITRHTATGSKWSVWCRPFIGVANIGSDCDTLFDSLEEAQAACTRHASTGKWLPSEKE